MTSAGLDWAREKCCGSVASKFIRGGEKNAVKYADEIIALSKGVQKYFMETYGRETHFIPNGVNRPEIREAKLITDKFGLKKDSYILFLGRLVPEKGIRYLVEAFKNVKTDKKLVIAGGSSDTDSFMEELMLIELLKNLNPPVGVKFEADNIYTLDSNGRMILTILASVAEEESHSKSIIMNWSIDRRFSRGLFLTPALLGYDKDEEGNLVINPEEAQTVKVIYYLYLNGYSLTEIATLLMEYVEDLQEKLQDACDHPEMVMKMKNQAADFICEKYNWDEVVKETMKLYYISAESLVERIHGLPVKSIEFITEEDQRKDA